MSILSETHQAAEDLSIAEALTQAFQLLFNNFTSAVKLALFPALTLAMMGTASAYLITLPVINDTSSFNEFLPSIQVWLIQIALMLVSFFIMTQYFTSWVRFLGKGELNIKTTLLFFPEKRQLTAFAKAGGIIISTYILLAVASFVAMPTAMSGGGGIFTFLVVLALMISWTILLLRLLYVVPAAALDAPYSVKDSWRHTRSQSFRLFISFFILSVIYIIITLVLTAIFAALFSIFDFSIFEALANGDLATMTESPNFIWMYFTFNLVTVFISFLFYTPYMNMYLYCFKTNSGWQQQENIAETFS